MVFDTWVIAFTTHIALYREYFELTGRFELAQIYDEARYDVRGLLKLLKIVNDLELGEREIMKVLELVKHSELERLQWKVEYLRNEVEMLEDQKWKSTNHILKLNRIVNELQSSLPQNTIWYDNIENLHPTYPNPDTGSHSIQLSYSNY